VSENNYADLQIDTLKTEIGVTDERIQEELKAIWANLRDPDNAALREEANREGVPATLIDQCAEPPFSAERPEGQILIAGAVAIVVGKAALGWTTKKTLDVAWDRFFWPRLKRHFGADVERREDAG